jgi:hypothetical protein
MKNNSMIRPQSINKLQLSNFLTEKMGRLMQIKLMNIYKYKYKKIKIKLRIKKLQMQ